MNPADPTPIDPALEARIVAAVLGECSAFERAELDRLLAEHPERDDLLALQRDIESAHGLLAEAGATDREPWSLPRKKRAALLATLEEPAPTADEARAEPAEHIETSGPKRLLRLRYLVPFAAAAAFLLLLPFIPIPSLNEHDGFAKHDHPLGNPKPVVHYGEFRGDKSAASASNAKNESDNNADKDSPKATLDVMENIPESNDGIDDLFAPSSVVDLEPGITKVEKARILDTRQKLILQEKQRQAMNTYQDAARLYGDGRWNDAIQRYNQVLEEIPDVAVNDEWKDLARNGIADAYFKMGKEVFDDRQNTINIGGSVDKFLDRSLALVPDHEASLQLKQETDRWMDKVSRQDLLDKDVLSKRRQNVSDLLRKGKELYNSGDYDNAEVFFENVLSHDKHNEDSLHFLNKLSEKRYAFHSEERNLYYRRSMDEVRNSWRHQTADSPTPSHPGANPRGPMDGFGDLHLPSNLGVPSPSATGGEFMAEGGTVDTTRSASDVAYDIQGIDFTPATDEELLDIAGTLLEQGNEKDAAALFQAVTGGQQQQEQAQQQQGQQVQPLPSNDDAPAYSVDGLLDPLSPRPRVAVDTGDAGLEKALRFFNFEGSSGSFKPSSSSESKTSAQSERFNSGESKRSVGAATEAEPHSSIVPTDSPSQTGEFVTRYYPFDPNVFSGSTTGTSIAPGGGDPFGSPFGDPFAAPSSGSANKASSSQNLTTTFQRFGLDFPPGTSATYQPSLGQVAVVNSAENMKWFDGTLGSANKAPAGKTTALKSDLGGFDAFGGDSFFEGLGDGDTPTIGALLESTGRFANGPAKNEEAVQGSENFDASRPPPPPPTVNKPVVATGGFQDLNGVATTAPKYETAIQKVLVEEASSRLEVVPLKYDTRENRVEVRAPSTRIETTPAKFETVTEKVLVEEAASLRVTPAKYETRQVRVPVQPPSTRVETIPAVYETVTERVLVEEASTRLEVVPAQYEIREARVEVKSPTTDSPGQYRTVTQRVLVSPATTRTVATPAKYSTITRHKLVTPASTRMIDLPSEYKTIRQRVMVAPAKTREVPVPLTYTVTAREPHSTFSLHVSDASFKGAAKALAVGDLPAPASIRPEEFINAMPYGDPTPSRAEKIACRVDHAAHPFRQATDLFRIGLRTAFQGRGAAQPLRLTLLLDTSGSMERADRATTVQAAFQQLARQLKPGDTVSLIGFARTPRLLADQLPGNRASELLPLVRTATIDGGTNLEAALQLAGEKARQAHAPTAISRIVLLTDGAANLGDARPEVLAKSIVALREDGIAFDICGIGLDTPDDPLLAELVRHGDGRQTVLNHPDEADAGFARQLAGAFRPTAKNVKVQVSFNPERVLRHRLIGYEKHRLKKEDFRNDAVDAAELAAAESGVALYEVQFRPDGRGPVGTVSVRFRDVASNQMVERSWPLVHCAAEAFEHAPETLQLATAAASLAEFLKGDSPAAAVELDTLAETTTRLRLAFPHEPRVETLDTMVNQVRRLTE